MLGFRVWDVKDKTMIYDGLGFYANANGTLCDETEWGVSELDDETLYIPMQSTGQYDCQGQEIYEGDVVKRTGIYQTIFVLVIDCRKYWGIFKEPGVSTIIGNRFENPDLLEKFNAGI